MFTLCLPAIIYLVIALGALLVAPVAAFPMVVAIVVTTIVLQLLCKGGYRNVSWFLLVLMFLLPFVSCVPRYGASCK